MQQELLPACQPDDDHSPFGGSANERNILCPGNYWQNIAYYRVKEWSVKQYGVDITTHPQQLTGTNNHLIAAEVLNGACLEDLIDPDDKQYSLIQWYLEKCEEIRVKFNGRSKMIVESAVDLSPLHPEMGRSTIDFGMVLPGEYGWFADMKNCNSPVTKAEANAQAWTYSVGAQIKWGLKRVRFSFFNTVKSWESHFTFEADHLTAIRAKLRQMVDACLCPWAPCIRGEKQCQYCQSYLKCPATLEYANLPDIPTLKDVADMGKAELCRLWRLTQDPRIKTFKSFIGKLDQQITKLIAADADLTEFGVGCQRAKGKRVFGGAVNLKKLKELGEELDKPTDKLSVRPPAKLVTVAGLEKQWGKSKPVREAMAPLIETVPGKVKPAVIALPDYTKEG